MASAGLSSVLRHDGYRSADVSSASRANMTEVLAKAMALDALARPLISVVAPVYNEGATLREFVTRLIQVAKSLDHRYEIGRAHV